MIIRIITAVAGIIAAAGIITYGEWVFGAAVLLLSGAAWVEMSNMGEACGRHLYFVTCGGGTLALVALAALGFTLELQELFILAFLLMTLVFAALLVTFEGLWRHCHYDEPDWVGDVSFNVFTLIYCGLLFAHVILVRTVAGPRVWALVKFMDYGEALLWLVLFGTWASDTFAYFVGVSCGRHKFCSVSPKKSWEGAVGGFLGSMSVVILLGVHILGMPSWQAHVLGFAIALVAPVGDLVESVIKRNCGVKDSGKLLPGHGGVLDRFDSLLFVAPVAYYVWYITGSFLE